MRRGRANLVRVLVPMAVLLVGAGCGDEPEVAPPETSGAPASEAAKPAPSASAVPAAGDPLLDRARRGIRDGALPEALEAEVLQSSEPAHARAQRILLAMAEPPAGSAGAGEDDADDAGDDPSPPLLPPSDPSRVPEPMPTTKGDASGGTNGGGKTRPSPSRTTPPRGGTASLGKLALRSTAKGAVLIIAAPSSLVVGVANQPASGLVRLVIESAKAGGSVLTARPRVGGAAVTAVRQGQDTVQVTVELDPGWTLGSVQPFSGGAKVHLRAPPGS